MSSALLLYRLQQIDSRHKIVSARIFAITSALEKNLDLQAASKLLEETKASRRKTESALKNAEFESNNQRIKLEIAESSLYSGRIQNPKELQDLQKEITSFKRNLGNLEDQQLDLMISLESNISAEENAQREYTNCQGRVISENASLHSELANLQKELDNLSAQRQAVIPTIDLSHITLYDNLRIKRSGIAVSQVIDNACNTCGAALTPGLAQSVRTTNQLVLCPMCGRILYSN